MDSLIPVIGKLQDVFAAIGDRENVIQLPQIVVVGSQSAGKSSLVEGIVGKDFLPSGNGIVTRQPLLIHLIHTPMDDSMRCSGNMNGDWAIFGHKPNEVFTDFEKVRKEIKNETNRVSGEDKGISAVSINLKIYSANAIDLTLIDLPGITKVPVGDQPLDIEAQIVAMIKGYIQNPNSIILAVHPADQDLATSDSLKLARELDRNGDRTLCVLTKLDLAPNKTKAMEILTGNLIPVKLGIIGVVNRSPDDIKQKKSMKECLKSEMNYLKYNYPSLAAENGTQYLTKTLNKLLMNHIDKKLPELKLRIQKMKIEYENILDQSGGPILNKDAAILEFLKRFDDTYSSFIDGKIGNIETSELIGGARICYVFCEKFGKIIQSIDVLGGITDEQILAKIHIASGPTPPLFIPKEAFEEFVERRIVALEEPCSNCVDLVYEELLNILQLVEAQKEMQKFPRLFQSIKLIFSSFLSSQLTPTKNMVQYLVDINKTYINTKHPDFLLQIAVNEDLIKSNNGLLDGEVEENHEFKPLSMAISGRELHAVNIVKSLIDIYFNIARKSIQDMVPKAIMKSLVHNLKDNLLDELGDNLYKTKATDELLVESDDRKEASKMLDALNKAITIINEIHGNSELTGALEIMDTAKIVDEINSTAEIAPTAEKDQFTINIDATKIANVLILLSVSFVFLVLLKFFYSVIASF